MQGCFQGLGGEKYLSAVPRSPAIGIHPCHPHSCQSHTRGTPQGCPSGVRKPMDRAFYYSTTLSPYCVLSHARGFSRFITTVPRYSVPTINYYYSRKDRMVVDVSCPVTESMFKVCHLREARSQYGSILLPPSSG